MTIVARHLILIEQFMPSVIYMTDIKLFLIVLGGIILFGILILGINSNSIYSIEILPIDTVSLDLYFIIQILY